MEMAAMGRVFADVAGPLVISALWQGAALALGLALCLRLTPRIAAADRFRAWAAGFAALVALPFLPYLLSLFHAFLNPDAAAPGASLPGSAVAAPHAWFDLDPRWSLVIAAIWILASLARVVDLGVHTLRLRRIWKRAVPVSENPSGAKAQVDFSAGDARTEVQAYQSCIATKTSFAAGSKRVEVCSTRDLDRPSVIGFFAPRILIPEWLLERLTAAELKQVVLHEAEHLRRRDDWINLLQKLCLVVFPLNPALAWIERRLCREREMACDEGVVRTTQAPRAYAACLASLAERGLEHRAEALSLGAWQRRSELVARVHRILRPVPGLHPAAARALIGMVSCGLIFGSVELARCPRLVEFAARPAASLADMHAGTMVDGQPMGGFRAINAVAQVHTRAELAEARMAQRRIVVTRGRARWSPTLATGKTREDGARSVLAKTDFSNRPAAGAEVALRGAASADLSAHVSASAVVQPPQWIVYTAWEQVESTIADQGAGQAVDQTSGTPRVERQYTVTQLVLRVYPAAAIQTRMAKADATTAGAPRSGAMKTAPAKARTGSNTVPIVPLPAAIPIRDGWLVIQL